MPSDFEDRYGKSGAPRNGTDPENSIFPDTMLDETSESRPSLRELLKRKQANQQGQPATETFADETRIVGSQMGDLSPPKVAPTSKSKEGDPKNVNFAALIGEVRKNLGTESPSPNNNIQLDLKKARAEVNRVNQEIEEQEGRTRHQLVQEMLGDLSDAPLGHTNLGQTGTTEALFGFKGVVKKPEGKKQRTEKSMIRRINELASSDLQDKGRADGRRGTSGILRLPDTAILETIAKGPSGPYRIRVDDLEYGPTDSSVILELVEEGLITGADEISKSAWGGWQRLEDHPLFINYLERPFDRVLEEDSKIKIPSIESPEFQNQHLDHDTEAKNNSTQGGFQFPDETRPANPSYSLARSLQAAQGQYGISNNTSDDTQAEISINPFTSREKTVVQGPTLTNPMRPPVQTPVAPPPQERSKKFNPDFKELSVSDIAFELSHLPGASPDVAPPPTPQVIRIHTGPQAIPPPRTISGPDTAPSDPAEEGPLAPNGHPITGRNPAVQIPPPATHGAQGIPAVAPHLQEPPKRKVTQIGHHTISPRATLGGRQVPSAAPSESDIRNTSKIPADPAHAAKKPEPLTIKVEDGVAGKPTHDDISIPNAVGKEDTPPDFPADDTTIETASSASAARLVDELLDENDETGGLSVPPHVEGVTAVAKAPFDEVIDEVIAKTTSDADAQSPTSNDSAAESVLPVVAPRDPQPMPDGPTTLRRQTRLTPPPTLYSDDFEPKRSSNAPMIAIIVLALLAAAGGAYFLVFNKQNNDDVVAVADDATGKGSDDVVAGAEGGGDVGAGDTAEGDVGGAGSAAEAVAGADGVGGGRESGDVVADAGAGGDVVAGATDDADAGAEVAAADPVDAPTDAVAGIGVLPVDGSLRSERLALMQKLRQHPQDAELIAKFDASIEKQAKHPPQPVEITEGWAPFQSVGTNPTILQTTSPDGVAWQFIPEHDKGPTWRGDYAFYQLCGLIDCGFEVPVAKLATISTTTLNTLAGEKVAKDFPGTKGVVQGVLRRVVTSSVPFQIEDTSIWRNWLSHRSPMEVMTKPMVPEDFLGGSIETRTALVAKEPTVAQVAQGVANVLAADYLTNNFGRFARHRSNYGQNLKFSPEGPFIFEAINNQDAFQARESTRVRGRFNWSDRMGRYFLESVRRLKPDYVNAVLFPDITGAEKAAMSVFWEQRSDLLGRTDQSIKTYGEDSILF